LAAAFAILARLCSLGSTATPSLSHRHLVHIFTDSRIHVMSF